METVSLDTLFFEARTYRAWLDKPVSDELLKKLYETFKFAPTSANCNPGRFVFVNSMRAK
jgi:3-hydroxypropanoate dehydrogenase